MNTEENGNREIMNEQTDTELSILREIYKLSRSEGLKLMHSLFRDFNVFIALIVAILGGGILTQHNQIFLILPLLLSVYIIIVIGKYRTVTLISSYSTYIEERINQKLHKPVIIWESYLVPRHIATKGIWGFFLMTFIVVIMTIFYGAACWWAWYLHTAIMPNNSTLLVVYWLVVLILYIVNIISLVEAVRAERKYGLEYIEKEILSKAAIRSQNSTKTPKVR